MEYDEPLFFRVISYAEQTDRDVVDMVSGNPDWGAPPAISQGLEEYASLGGTDYQYPPAKGLPELRRAIAKDRGVDRDQVVVTNGAGEANYLGMALALDRHSGSEVVLTDPVYPYYPGKTSMLGGEQVFVETKPDGSLEPDAVRKVAGPDTACIVVNTPNNPTGAVYSRETMEELVRIAETQDALLVSDEVYDRFDHSGAFASALSVESPHRIVTGSLSKTFAITGFRVGYAIASSEHVDAIRTRHMLTNVTGSRPAQYAVLRAMKETPAEYYRRNRRLVQDRIDTFTGALEEIGAPYLEPDGAFYVMARIPGMDGTLENAFHMIDEAGVAGMPGESFGTARDRWFRFALVTPRVEEAADRLIAFVEG
ncbi:MAG: pyridoxal phosphate-dependent aminotransferase [Halodesulfurarchaeum sp.]